MNRIKHILVKLRSNDKNTYDGFMFLDRLKAREIMSDAFLQVVRIKPDDPIDFLYN